MIIITCEGDPSMSAGHLLTNYFKGVYLSHTDPAKTSGVVYVDRPVGPDGAAAQHPPSGYSTAVRRRFIVIWFFCLSDFVLGNLVGAQLALR